MKKLLLRFGDANAQYVSGYLLFLDGDTLLGQRFDAERLELRGQSFLVAGRVGRSSNGYGAVSASRGGTLAYGGTNSPSGRLTWFDRSDPAPVPLTVVLNWQSGLAAGKQ